MSRILTLFAVLITLSYPLVLWLAEGRLEPRLMAGLLVLAGLARFPRMPFEHATRWWVGSTSLLVLAAVWANGALPLKLYPVLVNGALLGLFAYSLVTPPTVVERFARMQEPDLPPQAIVYARRVTQVWCAFFVINGCAALLTAVYASSALGWFYNGFIAYLLIGLLFAGEYCVRRHFKRRLHD
ncbi:MAG TPA: hypothetical protein VF452_23805 [Candidatus Binatia bacterium]